LAIDQTPELSREDRSNSWQRQMARIETLVRPFGQSRFLLRLAGDVVDGIA
jgi:hypothetical protein